MATKLEDILLVGGAIATTIIGIVVIYMLILKMTGHSPTTAELALGLATLSLTISVTLFSRIGNLSKDIGKLSGQFESFEKYVVKRLK